MTDADSANALDAFRTSLPRRGVKGRDDRLLLEALHCFLVHNITWRALPERFGKWNSVWKRFDRLSQAGAFQTFFDHLAALSSSAHLMQMFDSTIVRAMSRRQAQKGAAGLSARPLARRLFDQNPPEDRPWRASDRLRHDRRRESQRATSTDPARAWSRHRSARGNRRQGLHQQVPTGRRPANAASSRHPARGQ